MKKISYFLILFISLFIVCGVVKAEECTDAEGNVYTFANGFRDISSIKGYLRYSIPYESPTSPYSTRVVQSEEIITVTNKYWDSNATKTIVWGKNGIAFYCPKPEELTYEVNEKNIYTVVVADSYVEKRNDNIAAIVFELTAGVAGGSVDWDSVSEAVIALSTGESPDEKPTIRGCSELTDYTSCVSNRDFSCVWVDRKTGKVTNDSNVTYEDAYCNFDNLQYVRCGNAFDIPTYLPKMISFVINLLKIVTPIILIFTSALSLLKAITASKEDEMNKAKSALLRRIIIAALIFFTISITEFVIDKVANGDEPEELSSCFNCFINNTCDSNIYYKNNINGEYICKYVDYKLRDTEFDGECH